MVETFIELYELARTLPTLVFIILMLGFLYIAFHVALFAAVTVCMPFYGIYICIRDKKYIQIKAEIRRSWSEWKQENPYNRWSEAFKLIGMLSILSAASIVIYNRGFEQMSQEVKSIVDIIVYIAFFNLAAGTLIALIKPKEKSNEQV